MNNNRLLPFILFTLILVAVAAFCKYQFSANLDTSGISPTIAIGLFSGMIISKRKISFLLPLISVFIADGAVHLLYMNGWFEYPGYYPAQWKNYLILAACTTMIGWATKANSLKSIFVGMLAAPTCFFLLSNFNVWISTTEVVYPKTFAGLLTCYEQGLPFYLKGLFSTLVFLPAILVLYNYMVNKKTALMVDE
jgi:hypothetical protein